MMASNIAHLNYCNETLEISNIILNDNQEAILPSKEDVLLYKIFCPPLIIACLLSFLLNLALYLVGTFGTHNKSPVLLLSLNLATTDTFASLLNAIGFIFNSYLPVVFNIQFSVPCWMLLLEMFRCSAFISSVLHLLAIAFIHYNGTVRPLHYRVKACCSQHVSRSMHLISLVCWLFPIITFLIYFSSIDCQGFQSINCDYRFLATKKFRYFICAFFLLPLALMLILYVKIFLIIQNNPRMSNRSSNNYHHHHPTDSSSTVQNDFDCDSPPKQVMILSSNRKLSLSSSLPSLSSTSPPPPPPQPLPVTKSKLIFKSFRHFYHKPSANRYTFEEQNSSLNPPKVDELTSSSNKSFPIELTPQLSSYSPSSSINSPIGLTKSKQGLHIRFSASTSNSQQRSPDIRSNNRTNNKRALITSLLILGTFCIGWLPALILLVLTCSDGCLYSFDDIPSPVLILIAFFCNFLLTLKVIVNPFIYTWRIREVRLAIKKLYKLPRSSSSNINCLSNSFADKYKTVLFARQNAQGL